MKNESPPALKQPKQPVTMKMVSQPSDRTICWICGADDLRLVKSSNIQRELNNRSFAISDSNYGVTGDILRCASCGFMQCSNIGDVLPFYEELEDPDYEKGRQERSLQARNLLRAVQSHRKQGRLLDIGAGTGILVERARTMGFDAEGIEPSRWSQRRAVDRGLPVRLGVVPHPDLTGPYDVVTLVDVLEHVDNPIELLRDMSHLMGLDGVGLIVTPDVGSWAARIMGYKWWHYRVAHIGYFNKKTIRAALEKAGLRSIEIRRAAWVFPASYLFDRVKTYLPGLLRWPTPSLLSRITIPINLFDSYMVICEKSRRG